MVWSLDRFIRGLWQYWRGEVGEVREPVLKVRSRRF